jgi:hypothetical protein
MSLCRVKLLFTNCDEKSCLMAPLIAGDVYLITMKVPSTSSFRRTCCASFHFDSMCASFYYMSWVIAIKLDVFFGVFMLYT